MAFLVLILQDSASEVNLSGSACAATAETDGFPLRGGLNEETSIASYSRLKTQNRRRRGFTILYLPAHDTSSGIPSDSREGDDGYAKRVETQQRDCSGVLDDFRSGGRSAKTRQNAGRDDNRFAEGAD